MGGDTVIDTSTDFGQRVARHLEQDAVVWLTTVGGSGAPAPNPVWFLWDGAAEVLVFSLPDAARTTHVVTNPQVSLNFAGDGHGGDIVVLAGTAALAPDAAPANARPEYLTKYASYMDRLGYTADGFAGRYSLPIRITLTRVRGH